MECLTSKYAAMKLLSFYIHIKNENCKCKLDTCTVEIS